RCHRFPTDRIEYGHVIATGLRLLGEFQYWRGRWQRHAAVDRMIHAVEADRVIDYVGFLVPCLLSGGVQAGDSTGLCQLIGFVITAAADHHVPLPLGVYPHRLPVLGGDRGLPLFFSSGVE